MQSLLGGADCGAASNPLQQMLKREGVDRSLMRDRAGAGPSGSSLQRLPQSQLPFRPSPSAQPLNVAQSSGPRPFDMASLSAGLASAQHQPRQQPQQRAGSPWHADFDQFQGSAGPANPQAQMARMEMERLFSAQQHRASPAPMHQHPAQQPGSHAWASEMEQYTGKGKGKAVQNVPVQPEYQPAYQPQGYQPYSAYGGGMGMEYAGASPVMLQNPYRPPVQESARVVPLQEGEQTDLDAAFDKAMKEEEERVAAERKEKEPQTGPQENGSGMGDFEAVWESLRPEAERLSKLAEWEKGFSQFTNGEEDYNFDEIGGMDAMHDQFNINMPPQPGAGTLDADGYPILGDYEFEQENPHVQDNNSLQKALDLLASGGSLTEAALLLEAAISSGTAEEQASRIPSFGGGGEAGVWVLLGQTQAMDEKEVAAVRALEEGRKRYEQQAARLSNEAKKTMGEGLISLAISYTNETYDHSALLALHRYMSLLHPEYAGSVPVDPSDSYDADFNPNPWSANQGLTESYLKLARDQNEANIVDADIQVGLGVLFYQTGEFEKARDCWIAALGVRPNDFLLWNRLGATLANGGHPEEAIDAYRRALELKPTFTRAIYNLGVSCLNIGVYQEAAEHLLAGLSLHQTQDHQTNMTQSASAAAINHSSTLWSTLRRTFLAMDRSDLAERAAPGSDLNFFREHGFDF